MKVKNLSLVLALVAMCVSNVSAQNFFWSTSDLGGTVVEQDLVIDAMAGDTGRAFLYYNPNGQDVREGIDLDFSWDTSGVAAFTAAETLEYDVTIMGNPFGVRWGDFVGPAETVSADAVTGFLTVNVVAGSGILTDQSEAAAGLFLDTGSQGDFFQLGHFDWSATADGTANLQLDNALVVDGGADIGETFSGLTINVGGGGGGPVVPEPTTASILGIGLIGLVARRRR